MAGIYLANFRAKELRRSQFPDIFKFGAGSDGAAETISGLVDAAVEGQMVSLVKRLGHSTDSIPNGTSYSVSVIGRAADESVHRFRGLNLNSLATEGDVNALFLGVVNDVNSAIGLLDALSAAPALPNTGQDITSTSVTITNKA